MLKLNLSSGAAILLSYRAIESVEAVTGYTNVCKIRTTGGFEHAVEASFSDLARVLSEQSGKRAETLPSDLSPSVRYQPAKFA